jgi:HlyD family secretion protein
MLDLTKPRTKSAPPAVAAEGSDKRVVAGNRRNWKPVIYSTILLAALTAAGASIWSLFFSTVMVQAVRLEDDVAVQVFGLGTVEARVTSQIGFKVSGVLADLRADLGDRLAKGSILAHLDDREQRAQVARASAAVEQATASLQKAMASVEKAKANHANARSIHERRQALLRNDNTSIEAAQTAQAVADAAFADLNLANSEVALAQAAISDAKAQQLLQGATLDFHTVVAPYDAMVIARLKETGSALNAGQTVFTLIDPQTVWVLAYIDESKAGEIKIGDPVQIVLRSHPQQRLQGWVARIQPESDRVNEERKVEVAFDAIPAYANLGEQAEVYVTTVSLPQALLVPEAAVIGLGKGSGTVWTVENGHLQQREVVLAHRLLDGRHEITGGLPDQAAVVSQINRQLRVGRAATISSEPKR